MWWGAERREIPVRLLPAVLLLISGVGTAAAARFQTGATVNALTIALVIAGPVALLFRRKAPVATLIAVAVISGIYYAFEFPHGPVFLVLVAAIFGAVKRGRWRAAWIVCAAVVAWMAVQEFLLDNDKVGPGRIIWVAVWLLLILAVANAMRNRQLAHQEAVRMYEEEQRRRVSDERLRIARELHDVLAHNISLINVQAGVALHLLDDDTEQARSALATIKQASKDTLREMRSVLGVLRRVDEDAPLAPAPGLDRVAELAADWANAGFHVSIVRDGEPVSVPTSVDQAGYRIIQEALTNVTKHSQARHASVLITYRTDELVLRIDDDGPAITEAEAEAGTGNGIPGMAERAAALGGQVIAVAKPDGGFRVTAHLPLT